MNTKKLHGREGFRIRVGNYRGLYLVVDAEKMISTINFPFLQMAIHTSHSP